MRRDDIRRLHETRNRAQALLDRAEQAGRDLTAEETAEFDQLQGQLERLGAEYRAHRHSNGGGEFRTVGQSEGVSSLAEYRARGRGPLPQDEREYQERFWRTITTADPTAIDHEDVAELRALGKASGAAGGYLVPTDFYELVIRSLRFTGSIGSLATEVRTDDGEDLPVPQNTAHGSASWTAEAGTYTASDETFAQATLKAYKATTQIVVSEELLVDSAFPLDEFLAQEFGERISTLEETAYLSGTGTGQPRGILDAGSSVTVVTAGVGNATSYTYSALVNLIFSVPIQYRPGSVFLCSDGAIKNLMLMVDSQGQPLWSPSMADGMPDRFAGFPVYAHPDLAAPAASAKDIVFGNFARGCLLRRAGGFTIQRQSELFSQTGQVGFRGYERVDFAVVLPAALRVSQHSAT